MWICSYECFSSRSCLWWIFSLGTRLCVYIFSIQEFIVFKILFWMIESPVHAFQIIIHFFHLSSRLLPPCVEKIWSSRASVCTSPTLSRNTTTLGRWWNGQGALGTGLEVRVSEAAAVAWGVAPAAWEISAISISTQPWWLPPRLPYRAVGVWWEC